MTRFVIALTFTLVAGCAAYAVAAPPAVAPAKAKVGDPVPRSEDRAKTVVDIAVASKDHTTLVAALKAADYVRSLQNPGPFTVFAPTNAAFDKLPKGTVEGLLKPEAADDLRNILKYHVAVSVYEMTALRDGMKLGQANGKNIVVSVRDGKTFINEAQIVASVLTGNGIVHVVDGVLLPPSK